jgi:hypothetical protein
MTQQPRPAEPAPPRLFALYRHTDVTGKSGTGVAAWGVVWPDGRANTWWALSPVNVHQIESWQHLGEVTRVHGHTLRTGMVMLGQVAAVEQFDTAPLRALERRYQLALVDAGPGNLDYLSRALDVVQALPALLDAHDRLAAAYAAQGAELEGLRAEHSAMQDALDTIADLDHTATTKGTSR